MALSDSFAVTRSPEQERYEAAIEWVAPHCDLERRLELVPPSAKVRGVWFRTIHREMKSRELLREYERLLPTKRHGSLGFHSVGEFLIRAAVAGALIAGPEQLHDGMYELARDNARTFAQSLMGRTLFRLLAKDPRRLTEQAVASSRQTTNYGVWEISLADEGVIHVRLRQEYVWIESYLLGAAAGTYETLGATCEANLEPDDPFTGTHIIRF